MGRDASSGPLRPDTLLRAAWRALPIVVFALYALGLAHAALSSIDPPRPDLAPTFLFPLAVPAVLGALGWRRATRASRLLTLILVFGTAGLVAATWAVARPWPISAPVLRDLFEASALVFVALVGVHAWGRGRRVFWLFFGPGLLYGFLLENGGIFLGYFQELDYRTAVPPMPAPIATVLGWVLVLYLAVGAAWEARRIVPSLAQRPLVLAGIATLAALLLDLQLDPFATALGYWTWHEALPQGPLGVPVLNYVAWISAVLPFTFTLFRWPELSRGALALRVPLILGAAAVLFLGLMAAVEGGFDGPTFRILVERIGALPDLGE